MREMMSLTCSMVMASTPDALSSSKSGYAAFDVFCDFFASFFTGEVTAHVVLVLVEQFVGIFVDGIQRTEQVDGDILFHKAFEFKS